MTRPRLVDLFCGGGGAAMGYYLAGFDVIGVDLVPQYDYPFVFVLADALTFDLDGFDAIHASPPCKLWTGARGDLYANRLFEPHPDQLTPTLCRLADRSVPWAVENVPGAPMPAGSVQLCGSSFGLGVRRHRLFASNVALSAPRCDHDAQRGAFPSLDWSRRKAGLTATVVGVHGNPQYPGHYRDACTAMDIDWLPWPQLTQAIPPAFTRHIGGQLMAALT